MLYFLDTSAVLNGALNNYDNIYVSPIVVAELEHIKTSAYQNDNKKLRARAAVRDIINNKNIEWSFAPQKKIVYLLKKYSFLSDINDHRLICEALLLQREKEEQIAFVTYDGTQYLFLQQFPQLLSIYYPADPNDKQNEVEYCGWGKYFPTAEQFEQLYTLPQFNILKAKTNEFCELYEGDKLKDIIKWDGEHYSPLKYTNLNNKFLNKTIKPLNLEQKLAFDLLQNTEVPVKLLIGPPGSGKDYLMLLHALDLIQKGIIDKIIFVRNLVPFKDAPEIGFLAGDLQEKIAWGLGPLASILGEEGLATFQEQNLIEAVNLGFIRGCSWDRTIIYISEGQNITGGGYKLLVSRCGQNSQLWVNGDIFQTDDKKFDENNGLQRLITSLQGNELFGMVKLLKTERSKTAELASII